MYAAVRFKRNKLVVISDTDYGLYGTLVDTEKWLELVSEHASVNV